MAGTSGGHAGVSAEGRVFIGGPAIDFFGKVRGGGGEGKNEHGIEGSTGTGQEQQNFK